MSDRSVLLSSFIDFLVSLACTSETFIDLTSGLLGDGQNINQLCIVQQVALQV